MPACRETLRKKSTVFWPRSGPEVAEDQTDRPFSTCRFRALSLARTSFSSARRTCTISGCKHSGFAATMGTHWAAHLHEDCLVLE